MEFEQLLIDSGIQKLVSKLYTLLLHGRPYVDTVKSRWEKDLQTIISEDSWCSIKRFNITGNISIQENRLRVPF